jgi:glycosyltransferase involved in cell wall biosynthesis
LILQKKKMQPDVSVIVATKNSGRYLHDALESIVDQSPALVDLIVVDAGSIDDTRAIAARYGARVIPQTEGRLAAAWNLGLAEARAPFLAFLDSDDRWVPRTLRPRLEALGAREDAVSVGRVRLFLEPGHAVPEGLNPDVIGRELNSPIPGTMIVPRALFDRLGGFDDSYRIAADVDWVGRALAAGCELMPFDGLVLEKRVHDSNLSLTGRQNSIELLRALRRRLGGAGF